MLSLFPSLLFLSPFAAFIIRLALAIIFGYSAYQRVRGTSTLLKVFGVIDAVVALMFLVGFWTQLAALIGIVCTVSWLLKSDWNPYPRSTALLALVTCASILVMGAGPFAFDLPL